jgi:hypothetical protein
MKASFMAEGLSGLGKGMHVEIKLASPNIALQETSFSLSGNRCQSKAHRSS